MTPHASAIANDNRVTTAGQSALPRWSAPARWLARLSLARRFMLASLVILVTGMFGIGVWVSHRIESGVIHRTSATTALFVDSFIQPHVQELAESDTISEEQARELEWDLSNTALGEEIAAFKVWNRDGTVVYSMQPELVGQQFPIQGDLRAAWEGEVSAEISTLDEAENQIERQTESRLLEIYTPVRLRGSDEIIAVAEFYQQTDDLENELASASRRSWLIVGGVTLVMYLLLAGFVQRASDTIAVQQRELGLQVHRLSELLAQNAQLHDRVSRAAARTTALNERFLRRFSAELHDGPAQDLSLALLKLDNVMVECAAIPGAEACADELDTIQQTVRRALQEVRSTSAGLLLPQLSGLSLADTVRHVVRSHERRTETTVSVGAHDLPDDVPLAAKIALYRVIQEALTNAARHAAGVGQRVVVSADTAEEMLTIEVSDEGPGFDAGESLASDEHLGLVGMRERVESLGGTLTIDSAPGAGTTVCVYLPLTLEPNEADAVNSVRGLEQHRG
jgi:signal transduction histidine kinase